MSINNMLVLVAVLFLFCQKGFAQIDTLKNRNNWSISSSLGFRLNKSDSQKTLGLYYINLEKEIALSKAISLVASSSHYSLINMSDNNINFIGLGGGLKLYLQPIINVFIKQNEGKTSGLSISASWEQNLIKNSLVKAGQYGIANTSLNFDNAGKFYNWHIFPKTTLMPKLGFSQIVTKNISNSKDVITRRAMIGLKLKFE